MDHLLTGDEYIMFDGMTINHPLSDFWAWSSSDLLNNTLRGAFAEFIVSSALGVNMDTPRKDWEAYDVSYSIDCKSSIRIEVKSAAYIQAWENKKLSRIQFSIRPTRSWSSVGGYDDEVKRQSDVYIFCVYTCKDRASADPLKLDDWEFYVLPTSVLSARCSDQQSISLRALKKLHPAKVAYDGIEYAVIEAYRTPIITPRTPI